MSADVLPRPGAGERAPTRDVACPACRRAALEPFFELCGVPVLANVLWSERAAAAAAPRADLRLARCRGCGMIANVAFAPERLAYGPAYENALHGSGVFRAFASALARELVTRHGLRGGSVVEIGCGQGEFLRELVAAGAGRGRGFDPSYDPVRAGTLSGRVAIAPEDFVPSRLDHVPDLICCRHVLEHLPRPLELLEGLRRALPDDAPTILYVEVPAGEWVLGPCGLWDLIYEHCGYYLAPCLAALVERAGFAPVAVRRAYGGQFSSVEARVGDADPREGRAAEAALASGETTAGFDRRSLAALRSWRGAADRIAGRGGRGVIWGAGSKGVTFLNLVDPGARAFVAAVDLNPVKQGRFVSGTGHPIVSPDVLREIRPTHVLVMNPLYRDEIAKRLAAEGIGATLMSA